MYDYTADNFRERLERYGYVREEYGFFNNRFPITREEFDDGSAVINDKIVDTKGS